METNLKKEYICIYIHTHTHTHIYIYTHGASPMAQQVKNSLAMQEPKETQVRSLGQEDALEEKMATNSCILVWKIPRTEEPGGLHCTGSQRVRHDWSKWAHAVVRVLYMFWILIPFRKMTYKYFLPFCRLFLYVLHFCMPKTMYGF